MMRAVTTFIPDSVLERKAYELLSSFEMDFGRILEPPIPINKIIERHLELDFDWDDIDDSEDEKILGFLDPSTRKIHMNSRRRDHFDTYVGSEAFTQAHEVAHWQLHVTKADEMQLEFSFVEMVSPFACTFSQRRSSTEIQADRYAAYLLMPHHLIRQEIERVKLTSWVELKTLSKRFGVTPTALRIRLEGMGLLL